MASLIERIENTISELGDNATFERVCHEVHEKKKSVSMAEIKQNVFYGLAEYIFYFEKIRTVTVLRNCHYERFYIISWRNYTSVVIKHPFTPGWLAFSVISEGKVCEDSWSHIDYSDRASAVNSTVMHLAQLGYTEGDSNELPEALLKHVKFNDLKTIQVDWLNWVTHQKRYQQAKAYGLNATFAHSFVGRNPALLESDDDAVNLEVLKRLQYLEEKSKNNE